MFYCMFYFTCDCSFRFIGLPDALRLSLIAAFCDAQNTELGLLVWKRGYMTKSVRGPQIPNFGNTETNIFDTETQLRI